jgi:hypothetical protein
MPTNRGRRFGVLVFCAAAVAGTAAFLENSDKIVRESRKICEAASVCPTDPGLAPTLAGYDSPEMGGGHNPNEQCSPALKAYQAQYPRFNISVKSWEDNNKNWLGHVTYHYHCRYSSAPRQS